jgi:hypothetical protein
MLTVEEQSDIPPTLCGLPCSRDASRIYTRPVGCHAVTVADLLLHGHAPHRLTRHATGITGYRLLCWGDFLDREPIPCDSRGHQTVGL